MIQRHEIKNKIEEILNEVNQQFEVLQQFDTDVNVEILNAKIAYLANFSDILRKISSIEKIEGSLEYTMCERVKKVEPVVLENRFKAATLPEEGAELQELENMAKDHSEELKLPEPFLIIRDEIKEGITEDVIEQKVSIENINVLEDKTQYESKVPDIIAPVVKPRMETSTDNFPIEEAKVLTKSAERSNSINDLFAQKGQELNDASVTSTRLSMPIQDLKMAFGLNDRILFIRELFNGYNLAFSEAIEALNQKKTFEEAKVYMQEHYANQYNWVDKNEVVLQFYNIVKNKYSS